MFVYQGVAVQKSLHRIKKEAEFKMTGHVIEDPLCIKFDGYEFIEYDRAVCGICREE